MKKKKLRLFCLLLCCSLFLGGCGSPRADSSADTIKVVCTIFPPYDFVRQVAQGVEKVQIKMLLKPGQESHDYDPSSEDILAIHDCDLFLYGGGESDSWIDGMLDSVDLSGKTVISMMEKVELSLEEQKEGMEADPQEDAHEEYDEHVWTSPLNAMTISQEICDALCGIDPTNAALYRQNTEDYIAQLTELDNAFSAAVAAGEKGTIVVADRFPLKYFTDRYGLDYYAAFSGCAASVEPSSATVQFLIDKVKELDLKVVFQMDLSQGLVADTVAEASGAKVLTFYSCHNLSKNDFEQGETYLSLMYKNLDALKEALQG